MIPLTVIIPTYNEGINLPHSLNSVGGWAGQIIVVDSGSTDNTVEIAKSYGAEVFEHPYENMAAQRMWSLSLPCIKHDWVLNLDADEYVTAELKSEVAHALNGVAPEVSGFIIRRKHIFLGRWMRHGGDFIWLMRLVRPNKCRIIRTALVNEHTIVHGEVRKLDAPLVHETKKNLTEWMQRVNKGAQKVALGLYRDRSACIVPRFENRENVEGRVRTFLNYAIYARAPLVLRPVFRFLTMYVLRGGFLDGWQGFVYHFINDFFYPFLIWAKYKEFAENRDALNEAVGAKWR